MRGFKSFGPKRTSIKFDKGFTVVTGPNGSGKSNILDAIRFVLGDISARSLRADRMAKVIFDGSPDVKASSSSSVSIQFDNSNRKIPYDTNTVTVSRTVDKSGTSKYRIDGKIISRNKFIDILNVAGISFSGHNIVVQGTITKLADITPEERRKVIEDLIGIAEYNQKKNQAQTQLRQADINLRVASARINEVQNRVESLEKERNDALRYNYIQNEILKLQSIIISRNIIKFEQDITQLKNILRQKKDQMDTLKKRINEFRTKRKTLVDGRRRFEDEITEKGGSRLIEIEKTIGEFNAEITGLKTEIDSNLENQTRLVKIKKERENRVKILKDSIEESIDNIEERKLKHIELNKILKEKTKLLKEVTRTLAEERENFDIEYSNSKNIENEIVELNKKRIIIDAQTKSIKEKNDLLSTNLQELKSKRENFILTLKDLQTQLKKLKEMKYEKMRNLTKISKTLNNNLSQKENIHQELIEAEQTLTQAKKALIEFKTRINLANILAIEEKALQKILMMAKDGAVKGVYGVLESLISVKPPYKKAIEAASSGWLKAILVEDINTALKCVDILQRMKICKIKIIPLNEIPNYEIQKTPNDSGIIDLASKFVKCDEQYLKAIKYLLRNTVIASGEKSAFLLSRKGYRSVDLNGNLYEANGGIESGFHDNDVKLLSLIPSDKAFENLESGVNSLEILIDKRKTDIDLIEREIEKINSEKISYTDRLSILIDNEVDHIGQNVKRISKDIDFMNQRIININNEVMEETQKEQDLHIELNNLEERMTELEVKKKLLQFPKRPDLIAGYEIKQNDLRMEINELKRKTLTIESEIKIIEENLNSLLKPEFESAKKEINEFNEQVLNLESRIDEAQDKLIQINEKLSKLQDSKKVLIDEVFSVKDERESYDEKIDQVNLELTNVDNEYYVLTNECHQLDLTIETKKSDLRHLNNELNKICSDIILDNAEEIEKIENSLNQMLSELEILGSVNQLANSQYVIQQENYKKMSIRRNEIEGERKAIIQFMEEIERQKRDAFQLAYNRINEDFTNTFSKLTGGGRGWLELKNPENPFSGGLDLFVQFQGKSPRLITGASGGEKSVAAVSFIFAIQNMFPAPFYVFDEIAIHLDHYNAEKLADLLKEQSINSQFIVITLRDVLIDRSDRIFGVYSNNGLSNMVSVNLLEAIR